VIVLSSRNFFNCWRCCWCW